MRRLILFVILAIVIGVGVVGARALMFIYSRPTSTPESVVFEVKPGSTARIAEELFEQGLITNTRHFVWLARFTGNLKKIRVGEYALNTAMLPYEVLGVLTSGKSILHTVTFPEGTNRFEMADILQRLSLAKAADFLALTKNPQLIKELLGVDSTATSLEGYLFPDTYAFTKYTGGRAIVRTMVEKFQATYADLMKTHQLPSGFTKQDAVILASMIEKETGDPAERPIVASVFFNRLKIKMKLQSDPTTMYGVLETTQKPVFNITRAMLLTPTKYNTYTVAALPAGPISNPGRASLEAVMKPATSDFLYFVSHNDGTHAFSKTLAEHNASVKNFQLDPKAREGKSWRDLTKKKAGGPLTRPLG